MEGKVIDNKIFVIEHKGGGHAGEVYKARLIVDTDYGSKNDEIAIKIYNSWVLSEPHQAARIDLELQSSLKVNSENVVKSYELLRPEDEMILVMEYLRGRTLSRYLEEEKKLSFDRIIEITTQILKGLEEFHKNKLSHRDLKPDNIMVTDERIVIMDLGVIKDFTASTSITRKFLGTIKYAAPEYLFDEEYDKSIDLFSFGLILYELIFGESLITTEYWTMNIVEHYFYKFRGPSEYVKHYSEFPDRFGEEEKLFLWILLNCLLENKDYRIRLEFIIKAIEKRIWESIIDWEIFESQVIRYQKQHLRLSNYLAIKDIERLLDKPILYKSKEQDSKLWFMSSDGYVTNLALGKGSLKMLPESIGHLIKLESLYLVGNDIEVLPSSFSKLESLSFLNLLGNKLVILNDDLRNLSSLEDLTLDLFYRKQFPAVIAEFKSLKTLYIWGYKSDIIIPENFKNLDRLEELTLMVESLVLPEGFGQLKSLKKLWISTKKMSNIPQSFWDIKNLVELDFKVEDFTTLPPEIKNFKHLEILILNGNSMLSEIPAEIQYLTNLRILEFHNTNIKDLPEETLKLTNLEEIYSTSEFAFSSKIAKKLREKGVNVVSFRLSTRKKTS